MTQPPAQAIRDHHQFALVAQEWAQRFQFEWFSADYWEEEASLVGSGGRGAAWFIDSTWGQWVLRHYMRGGLPGRWLTSAYCFLGRSRVRSIQEFKLLQTMHAQGLPVPRPIAAYYRRAGLLYRAALIIERIPAAKTLTELKDPQQIDWWHAAGRCIRRFHDRGIYHADLNTDNILMDGQSGELYLIDFDRGYYHPDRQERAPWKRANLARLARSAHKKGTLQLASGQVEQLLNALNRGYADSDEPQ